MKKFLPQIKIIICFIICIAVCIAVPCVAFTKKSGKASSAKDKAMLRLWQIDGFEGGKGSRADLLQSVGNEYSKQADCYITVTSLSADAARANLAQGNVPDLISYGAGMYGVEQFVSNFQCWCNGGYCFLTLDTAADFSDINSDNTLINGGKDNLAEAAALLGGVSGAEIQKPTAAYVSLINGKFKYLLGTQRDVFRLRTRGVSFSLKPVTQFNDLYQNISVCAEGERAQLAQGYVNFLLARSKDVGKVGMFSANAKIYDDELKAMEGLKYDYKLTSPISEKTKNEIEGIISDGDINKLKNLLK